MTSQLDGLLSGFALALTWSKLGFALIGCLLGTLIGVLPGIGPVATVSMLLSMTVFLDPLSSLVMLTAIYYGAQYGGSTTAILCILPGEERVARMRGRPVENKWIGQRIDDPAVDIAGMGRAQGALGIGPVKSADALVTAFREALMHVDAGGVAVIDVFTEPGYTPAMVAALNNTVNNANAEKK